MSNEEYQQQKEKIISKCRNDFPFFCENILQVKSKSGGIVPFRLNKAQRKLDELLNKQKHNKGKVRAIIVKGRQLGISTYISARYYHNILFNRGSNAFVFAHDIESSQALFNMVKLYMQEPQVANVFPTPHISNIKEIFYETLKSKYRVGTAGSKGLGRGMTNNYVHWSEVAFSPHAETHIEGLLQSVPNEKNTEVILESTANGMGDVFYNYAMSAENGESAFQPIFLPYYLDEDYKIPLPEGFTLKRERDSEDIPSEQEYYDRFIGDGLTKEHLLWRREKIATDFAGQAERFMQEYPVNMLEAFKVSASEAYISPNLFHEAHLCEYKEDNRLPRVMGVDPARLGKDQFSIAIRKGRVLEEIITLPKADTIESTEKLIELIEWKQPDIINIDGGNIGSGIYDNLKARGYGHKVNMILFNNKPTKKIYKDKAAEMFDSMKNWLEDKPCDLSRLDASLIDRLISQVCMRAVDWSGGPMKIESKSTFKNRLKYSPDEADSVMLTFGTPYKNMPNSVGPRRQFTAQTGTGIF